MSYVNILREYGSAFRGDWSDIDGRTVSGEMDDFAAWVETPDSYPGDIEARGLLGLCLWGHGRWSFHCDHDREP